MKEDLSIFFRDDEHAVTADYYPAYGDPVIGMTVILDEGNGNDIDSEIVSDKAVIDIMRSEFDTPEPGDEVHICNQIWVVTGFAGADLSVISITAEKGRRPSYA